jgi:hypothetical protein
MFQFPTFAFLAEYPINRVGCPIRISTDQFVLADPRGFSQLITSFLASESLGIPRAPLITYFYFLPHRCGILLQFLLQYVNELYSLLLEKRNG